VSQGKMGPPGLFITVKGNTREITRWDSTFNRRHSFPTAAFHAPPLGREQRLMASMADVALCASFSEDRLDCMVCLRSSASRAKSVRGEGTTRRLRSEIRRGRSEYRCRREGCESNRCENCHLGKTWVSTSC
jgi:hypothetical protein